MAGTDAVADWQPPACRESRANPKDSDKLQISGAIPIEPDGIRGRERLEEAVAAEAAFPKPKARPAVPVYTGLFQAMTLHRLGRTDKAQQQLRKAMNDSISRRRHKRMPAGTAG